MTLIYLDISLIMSNIYCKENFIVKPNIKLNLLILEWLPNGQIQRDPAKTQLCSFFFFSEPKKKKKNNLRRESPSLTLHSLWTPVM